MYPDNTRETFVYTLSGKLQKHVQPSGLTVTYEYDGLDRVIAKRYCAATGEQIAEETMSYRGKHCISETDKEGSLRTFEYDGAGRKIREVFCGRITETSYDTLGRVASITKHNETNTLVMKTKRDLLDRLIEKTHCDREGNVLSQITHCYDEAGNLSATTRSSAEAVATEIFTHDSRKRRLCHTDANGHVTRTHYDDSQTNQLGQRVIIKAVTDPNGIRTIFSHDAQGHRVKKAVCNCQDKLVLSQEMFYDPVGNLLEQHDQNFCPGQLTKTQSVAYTYTERNRVATLTRAAGSPIERVTHYSYTPDGQVDSKTLPSGLVLNYSYDAFGSLATLTSSDDSLSLSYQYDSLGRLRAAHDIRAQSTLDRTLDNFGNVLTERLPTGLTLTKSYDAFDRPLSLAWSQQSQVQYTYDPMHLRRVTKNDNSGQVLYEHAYDAYDLNGNIQRESLIADLGQILHTRDLKGRHTAISSDYLLQQCVYDAVDNLIQTEIDTAIEDYAYDDLAQLTKETRSDQSHTYLYDSHSNRREKDGLLAEVNDLDEVLSQGSVTCSYDQNGNLAVKQSPNATWVYTYDPLNRLTCATSVLKKIIMTYDPIGRRLSRVAYRATNYGWEESDREHYLYDGINEIGNIEKRKDTFCIDRKT